MKDEVRKYITLVFFVSLSFLYSISNKIQAQSFVYVCCVDKSLYKINIDNCTSQLIGYTSVVFHDIAINPQNNTMYGMSCYGNMYTISLTNASCNLLGSAIYSNSLTFDSYGFYYIINSQTLYKINPITVLGKNMGQLPSTITPAGDLTFFKNKLYLSSTPSTLSKLNTSNASLSTNLGNFLFNSLTFGLTTVMPENQCKEVIYAFPGKDIYRLDTTVLTYSSLKCSNVVPSGILGAASFSEAVSTSSVKLGSDKTICSGDSIILTDYSTSPADSFLWQNGHKTNSIIVKTTSTNILKKYWWGCEFSDTIDIVSIKPPTVNIGNDTAICINDSIDLFDLTNSQYDYYIWQNGSTTDTFRTADTGLFFLTKIWRGCNNSDSINISYKYPPKVDLGPDTSICISTSLVLYDLNTSLADKYHWQDGSSNSSINASVAGQYTLTKGLLGCYNSDTINISLSYPPFVSISNDTFLCENRSIFLELKDSSAQYLWSTGNTDNLIEITESGTYWVIAHNRCGTVSDSITVSECQCKIAIPNAFSPNGDGLNDVFEPKFDCHFKKYNFKIYNRWGELLFDTYNPFESWNGTYQFNELDPGVYVYIITYQTFQDKTYHLKGNVYLVK
ncbi:MAG: hypothetical protein DRI84_04960 [Bacteroidetes bacterium]|nr:MAG: hypothetical protein DRI84_04960 [Bacteroidota bacterium]